MKATKEIVETRVVEALSATPHKAFTVDKNLEPYALYNALVGTTFDAESYAVLAESEEGVQYLYDHIPGGVKLVKEGETIKELAEETTEDTTEEIVEDTTAEIVEDTTEEIVEDTGEETNEETTPTPAEVEEHKGEEVTEENEKFDLDKDGDIDDDDVAKASEIEVS